MVTSSSLGGSAILELPVPDTKRHSCPRSKRVISALLKNQVLGSIKSGPPVTQDLILEIYSLKWIRHTFWLRLDPNEVNTEWTPASSLCFCQAVCAAIETSSSKYSTNQWCLDVPTTAKHWLKLKFIVMVLYPLLAFLFLLLSPVSPTASCRKEMKNFHKLLYFFFLLIYITLETKSSLYLAAVIRVCSLNFLL